MRARSQSERIVDTPVPQGVRSAAQGPLVSVGLPVYNGERFLRGAIESILAQTYRNFELIIADNASTDNTNAICDEYVAKDSRVRYVRHPRNMGVAKNWNFVAESARGKYLRWSSANDYCNSEMFASCVQVLESNPEAILCYGMTQLVDEDTDVAKQCNDDISLTENRPSIRLARLLMELKLNNAISGLIRIDGLRGTGLIRVYPGGDIAMMAELAMAGKFVLLPKLLQSRRIGTRTFSSKMSASQLETFFGRQTRTKRVLHRIRANIDLFVSVVSAPISLSEKRYSILVVARNAYWAATGVLDRLRHFTRCSIQKPVK